VGDDEPFAANQPEKVLHLPLNRLRTLSVELRQQATDQISFGDALPQQGPDPSTRQVRGEDLVPAEVYEHELCADLTRDDIGMRF